MPSHDPSAPTGASAATEPQAWAEGEAGRVLLHAAEIADSVGAPPSTVHALLAFFAIPSGARDLLIDAGVDHRTLLRAWQKTPVAHEAEGLLAHAFAAGRQVALRSEADEFDARGLLAALLRQRQCAAVRLLASTGVDVAALRNRAIGALTASGPDGPSRLRFPQLPATPTVRPVSQRIARLDAGDAAHRPPAPDLAAARAVGGAAGPVRVTGEWRSLPPAAGPGVRVASPEVGARDEATPALPSPARDAPAAVGEPDAAAAVPDASPAGAAIRRRAADTSAAHAATTAAAGDRGAADGGQPVGALDPARFPMLSACGRDLTAAAAAGELTPVIGRDALIDAIVDVLLMRKVNNPCLIGEAGVGKTALVEGLAQRLWEQPERFGRLAGARIVEVPVSALIAGTAMRGAFAERMRTLREEVAAGAGAVIVFIDELHTLMGAGAGDGPLDAANDLKTALARGRFPLIGATTRSEYRRFVEADPAMERRFQVIEVPEPSAEEAVTILTGLAPNLADHHRVAFAHDGIVAAIELSRRFLPERALPDKAIAVLDRAGAQAHRRGRGHVTRLDVAHAVASLGHVGVDQILSAEQGRARPIDLTLLDLVHGHEGAIQRISRRISRNHLGLQRDRPLGSFVLAGPPGCGKTHLAEALAAAVFLRPDAVVRIDLGDFGEAQAVSRLLGSPPGYVGHQQAGLLSEALYRRPYRLILFENIDRACAEVCHVVQQLVAEGKVIDGQGRTIDARLAIVVATLTLPPEMFGLGRRQVGFQRSGNDPSAPDLSALEQAARRRVVGDVASRVDELVVLTPLGAQQLRAIAAQRVGELAATLLRERLVRCEVEPAALALLVDGTEGSELGVRATLQRVEEALEVPIGAALVDGDIASGDHVRAVALGSHVALIRVLEGGQATAPIQSTSRRLP